MATEEELKAEIERLRAENESLKKPTRGQTSLKVSEKGGLSVYGLGRFPVTRGNVLLIDSAVNAVRQWLYTPTLVNGVPVPILMNVTVTFELTAPGRGRSASS